MTDRIRITKNRKIARQWCIEWTDAEGFPERAHADTHANAIRRADWIIKRRRRAA